MARKSNPAKSEIDWMIVSLVSLAVVVTFGIVMFLAHRHPAPKRGQVDKAVYHSTQTKYFKPYPESVGFSKRDYTETSIPGIEVSWLDTRPADGDLECTVYLADTKQIIAEHSISSGYTVDGSIANNTTFYNKELSDEQAQSLINTYCGK